MRGYTNIEVVRVRNMGFEAVQKNVMSWDRMLGQYFARWRQDNSHS